MRTQHKSLDTNGIFAILYIFVRWITYRKKEAVLRVKVHKGYDFYMHMSKDTKAKYMDIN